MLVQCMPRFFRDVLGISIKRRLTVKLGAASDEVTSYVFGDIVSATGVDLVEQLNVAVCQIVEILFGGKSNNVKLQEWQTDAIAVLAMIVANACVFGTTCLRAMLEPTGAPSGIRFGLQSALTDEERTERAEAILLAVLPTLGPRALTDPGLYQLAASTYEKWTQPGADERAHYIDKAIVPVMVRAVETCLR